ncbi:MAG TPA: tetratricopeptide repeat protein [Hyphomicrobiaceae bacterium]|nr:tetratricopeptide repeat protein [Hyphomicrobiaceae bacterium]
MQLLLVLLLSVMGASVALANESYDCFSRNNDRRIDACSRLIETPGLPTDMLSSAYAMRALAYSLRGQYEIAIRDYDKAIELVPNYPMALNNRAWAYFRWGKPTQGLPDVEKSLALDPTSEHAYDTRAHIRQWLGNTEAAIADYEAAMRIGGRVMIKTYQCGLQAQRLYHGPIDGRYSRALGSAMIACVERGPECDPLPQGEALPPDEECYVASS